MPIEIERKFLVTGEEWRLWVDDGADYCQGYIGTHSGVTVRVRTAGEQGFITFKGPRSGISRAEYETVIPHQEAAEMLELLCDKPLIKKHRYLVKHDGFIWEVDEFAGDNAGLVIAEIELQDENQHFALPTWVGEDVSEDPRYTNLQLTRHPYSCWH